MIRRAPAAVVLAALVGLGFVATPAGAQTAGPAVTVDLSGQIDAPADEGVLVRTDSTTLAPMMAVYVGLSLVGTTLALITLRRRGRHRTAAADERTTGVVPGRRSRADFWDLPGLSPKAPSRVPRARPSLRPQARSGLSMLVGSGETESIAEHRPPVRAGYVRGANDG